MVEYTLKDKIQVTNAFVKDLCDKSWQEVEHLQNQLVNLEESEEGKKVSKLIKNLLTGYYVFIGSLENIDNIDILEPETPIKIEPEQPEEIPIKEPELQDIDCLQVVPTIDNEVSEPFEYFVDFDEPVGEPLTDKDLYN